MNFPMKNLMFEHKNIVKITGNSTNNCEFLKVDNFRLGRLLPLLAPGAEETLLRHSSKKPLLKSFSSSLHLQARNNMRVAQFFFPMKFDTGEFYGTLRTHLHFVLHLGEQIPSSV
jgi:hypothetical protein